MPKLEYESPVQIDEYKGQSSSSTNIPKSHKTVTKRKTTSTAKKISSQKTSYKNVKLAKSSKKLLKKVRKTWNQNNIKNTGVAKKKSEGGKAGERTGTVSTKNAKYIKKTYGTKELNKRLREAERYAQGLAYSANIDALITRIDERLVPYNPNWQKVINILRRHKSKITEDCLSDIIQTIYDMQNNGWNADSTISQIIFYIQESVGVKNKKEAVSDEFFDYYELET